jgi:hypothetical protein
MRIPSVTDFDQDPLAIIETGDWVRVDGDSGTVEITKKADMGADAGAGAASRVGAASAATKTQ